MFWPSSIVVNAPACQAGLRQFESDLGRLFFGFYGDVDE